MNVTWPMKVLQIIMTTAIVTLVFILLNESGVFTGSYSVPFENGWLEDFVAVFIIFLPFITLITAVMFTMKKWLAQKYENQQEERIIYYYFILVVVVNAVIVLVVQLVFLEKIGSFSWMLPIITLITFESFELLSTRNKEQLRK